MSTINFTARLVDQPTIQKRSSWFRYSGEKASIVELDNTNTQDMKSLRRAAVNWDQNGAKYAEDIFCRANHGYKKLDSTSHYYALTTQKQNFEKLNPKEILGLMLFHEKINPTNEIGLLEVNPNTNKSFNLIRKYKQVGRKLVEFVQSEFPKKDIEVWADYNARNFYKKLGFVQNSSEVCDMLWRAAK